MSLHVSYHLVAAEESFLRGQCDQGQKLAIHLNVVPSLSKNDRSYSFTTSMHHVRRNDDFFFVFLFFTLLSAPCVGFRVSGP
jgi:hypothetical protein